MRRLTRHSWWLAWLPAFVSAGCVGVPSYQLVRVVPAEQANASAAAVAEPATAAGEEALVTLKGELELLAESNAEQKQQLLQLQQQVATLERRLLELNTDLDRLQNLVVTRYEQFLREDRKVLEQLDAALTMWIETMSSGQSGTHETEPSSETGYRSATAAPEPQQETGSDQGQVIILR